MKSKSVIVGTAGHIDHGKTALVKALTGIDADRLEEEKRRGITIDIGFAHLNLPSGGDGANIHFGFIDVPGHERFVHNMLAGVGGIDFVLLVIAADEGIKPQTCEHFDICRMLGIQHGIVVLTKSDKVNEEGLRITRESVKQLVANSFLAAAPMVAVSTVSGDGITELKNQMLRVAERLTPKRNDSLLRLPIDRVFTMKGHGSVVTGTLVSGTIRVGDEVEILPPGQRIRVRSVQVHNNSVEAAHAGERTALNLPGVSKADVNRGMTLVTPGTLRPTTKMDVRITLLPNANALKDGARIHFHSYSSETIATVQLRGLKQLVAGMSVCARLQLFSPLLQLPGDRFIIRQFSPVVTIGGGTVLDAMPLKQFDEEFLSLMLTGSNQKKLLARVSRCSAAGLKMDEAIAETGWTVPQLETLVVESERSGEIKRVADTLVSSAALQVAECSVLRTVKDFHAENPLLAGIKQEELRARSSVTLTIFNGLLDRLITDKKLGLVGDMVHLAGRIIILKDDEAQARETIERAFQSSGLNVPAMKDVVAELPLDKARAQKIVSLLLRERVLIKLSDDLVFHSTTLDALRKTMQIQKIRSKTIDVARFKELTGVSRKYAIPLLEFLDRERITRREGGSRVIL